MSGCADGCLLTNYPFVRDYISDYGFIGLDEQPVRFLKKTEIAELRLQESKRKEELRRQRSLERLKAVENKTTGDLAVSSSKTKASRKGDNFPVPAGTEKRNRAKTRDSVHSIDTSVASNHEGHANMETIEYDKISDR